MTDRPYVDNYPPLRDFLREVDARCDWQLPLGEADDPTAYVEQWRIPAGHTMIVTIHRNGFGWNIATPCRDTRITETFRDARLRLGLDSAPERYGSGIDTPEEMTPKA